jgi:hypothetical protein
LQKNWPLSQTHVVDPYVHCMLAGVEHAAPGAGCVVGQGASQRQVSPIAVPAPGKHVQLLAP